MAIYKPSITSTKDWLYLAHKASGSNSPFVHIALMGSYDLLMDFSKPYQFVRAIQNATGKVLYFSYANGKNAGWHFVQTWRVPGKRVRVGEPYRNYSQMLSSKEYDLVFVWPFHHKHKRAFKEITTKVVLF